MQEESWRREDGRSLGWQTNVRPTPGMESPPGTFPRSDQDQNVGRPRVSCGLPMDRVIYPSAFSCLPAFRPPRLTPASPASASFVDHVRGSHEAASLPGLPHLRVRSLPLSLVMLLNPILLLAVARLSSLTVSYYRDVLRPRSSDCALGYANGVIGVGALCHLRIARGTC